MTRYIIKPADEERVNEALASLKQRMQQLEPRADSKEPLVVQQVGLLIALLPEIGRLATPDYSSSAGNSCFGVKSQPIPASSWRRCHQERSFMNADNGTFKHKQNLFCHQTVLLPQSQPTHFAPKYVTPVHPVIPTSPRIASR